jgi:hypothetical protein
MTGVVAFMLGMGVLYTPPQWGWGAVCALLGLDAVFLVLVAFFSRQTEWTALHVLSLAAGGALAYGVHAFNQRLLFGGVLGMRISNAVFFAAAVWVIWAAARRVIRYAAA